MTELTMFLGEGCESFWGFGLEKPWRAWSLRSCSPGAWEKVQEGTPGGLVCVVSNENVCFPTRRTKIFPYSFLEIFNVLFVFYTSNIFYPHSPFLIASTLYWLLATTSNDWRCINIIDLCKSRSMTLIFSRTVLFNLSIPFFFICLFIFATLEAVPCSLCSVFT